MNKHISPPGDEDGLYPDTLSVIGMALFAIGISLTYWMLVQATVIDADTPANGYSLLLK